jgi:hypothetical protein
LQNKTNTEHDGNKEHTDIYSQYTLIKKVKFKIKYINANYYFYGKEAKNKEN